MVDGIGRYIVQGSNSFIKDFFFLVPAANVNASMKTWNMSYEQFLSVLWTAKLNGKKGLNLQKVILLSIFFMCFFSILWKSLYTY